MWRRRGWTRPKQLGRQAITGLRFRDEMAIIAAGTQPQVVCGLTGHERTLQTALAGIEPTDGPTRVAAAVELGKRLLADAKHGRVIVLSDGCFADSEKLADDKLVELRSVGTRAANVGITNFQVRRSLLDPIGYEILAEVANASDEPVECRLEIDLNDAAGRRHSAERSRRDRRGARRSRKPRPMAAGSWRDSIAPTRWRSTTRPSPCCPSAREQRVVLVSEGNLFLRKVLEVNPLVKLEDDRRDSDDVSSRACCTSFTGTVPEQDAGRQFAGHRSGCGHRPVDSSARSWKTRSSRSRTTTRR